MLDVDSPATVDQLAGVRFRFAVKALEWLVCLTAWAFLLLYAVIAIRRVSYPFDLEWMEGAMVDHVGRIVAGKSIYTAPSVSFVPFFYSPFYYYVSAAVSFVTGVGLLPLRLVSIASSVASFWLIYLFVVKETGSRYAGLIAAGMFAATYRISGAWFDLARVDSLFLLLFLSSVFTLYSHDSTRSWVLAGVLMALAALTKQTALMMAVPIAVYMAIVNWRHAMVGAAAFAAVYGLTTLALNVWTQGWYLAYTVKMPMAVQSSGASLLSVPSFRVITRDVLGAMPIAGAIGVASLFVWSPLFSRATMFYLLLAGRMISSPWKMRLIQSSHDNVKIPAHACFAILMALAAYHLPRLAPGIGERLRIFIALLCMIQFALLAYDPWAHLPPSRNVELHERLMERIEQSDGEVYLAEHGFFPTLRGKPSHAHVWAVSDVLRSNDADAGARLVEEFRQAFEQQRFRLIITDGPLVPPLQADLDQWYRRAPEVGIEGPQTLTGKITHPAFAYVPR